MRTPFLIINTKNYLEVSGDKILKLIRDIEYVASELKIELIIAPPNVSIGMIAFRTFLPILAQHTDPANPGSSTGAIVPEMIKDLGASGSLLNHSEKKIPYEILKKTIQRLRILNLISIVCARSVLEVREIAELEPDFIAIEPPELIGSGVAVSKAKPEIISESVKAAKEINSKIKVICGAGIVTGEDVKKSIQLGAEGVLIASGIIKANNWRNKLTELGKTLVQ